jgi:hypothetical protein
MKKWILGRAQSCLRGASFDFIPVAIFVASLNTSRNK